MHTLHFIRDVPKIFFSLTAAYFISSLGHFSHNAEFICEYPNLPAWLTRAQVYAVWAAITSVGVVCLLLMAVYAALGFDGLGHYAVAPLELHPWAANVTILSEVVAAALLLPVVLWLLASYMLRHKPDGLPS